MITSGKSTSPRDDLVGSLVKGLAMVERLADHPAGLTLSEAAALEGLTRAGARRLLLTLVETGHASQDGRRFRLTPRLLSLARRWLDGAPLWTFALGPMREVADALGESCSAAVLSDQDVVYVARVAGPSILSVALHVGTRLPAWCTSMGRVLLSDLEFGRLRAFLDAAPIERRTIRSVTDRRELERRIARVRAEGFAIVDEELELGLRSIAVPVRDRSGRIVAAINVSTQSARYTTGEMERRILPLLRKAAAGIEDFLALQ